MSAGYATKLSYRDDLGGQLGDPEISDAPAEVLQKVNRLSEWVWRSGNSSYCSFELFSAHHC